MSPPLTTHSAQSCRQLSVPLLGFPHYRPSVSTIGLTAFAMIKRSFLAGQSPRTCQAVFSHGLKGVSGLSQHLLTFTSYLCRMPVVKSHKATPEEMLNERLGQRFKREGYLYTYNWFIPLCGRNWFHVIRQSFSNFKKSKKKKTGGKMWLSFPSFLVRREL